MCTISTSFSEGITCEIFIEKKPFLQYVPSRFFTDKKVGVQSFVLLFNRGTDHGCHQPHSNQNIKTLQLLFRYIMVFVIALYHLHCTGERIREVHYGISQNDSEIVDCLCINRIPKIDNSTNSWLF